MFDIEDNPRRRANDMSTQSGQILPSALRLPESERAEIAAALIHSLDTQTDEADEAVDEAWAADIERRIATIDRGAVSLIPFDDVLAEMRRRGHG